MLQARPHGQSGMSSICLRNRGSTPTGQYLDVICGGELNR
jgi:hypothetical protein